MPRAIEIYIDEKEKAVLINSNYGNRENRGASWEPKIFRLGWDDPDEIARAARESVPDFHCAELRLIVKSGKSVAQASLLSVQLAIVRAFIQEHEIQRGLV